MTDDVRIAWARIRRCVEEHNPTLDPDVALVAAELEQAGARGDERARAIEECAALVEASSMNQLVEWGVTGLIVERQRNDLAEKIRGLLPEGPRDV